MNVQSLESLRRAFDEPISATPVESAPPSAGETEPIAIAEPVRGGLFTLIELILKDPTRLDRLIRDRDHQIEFLPRFLAISLIGFVFFGVAMSLVFGATNVWPHLSAIALLIDGREHEFLRFDGGPTVTLISPWLSGDGFKLIAAYAIGLIGATGICLPSLYFYGLLAGVRMTTLDIVVHALKSKAVGAVTLVGILPIYAALGLGVAIFDVPVPLRHWILILGLILPFIAGLAGTASLYRSLSALADTMAERHRTQRECFLKRLVLSWVTVYTAVSPVLIYTLWEKMQGF